MARLIAVSIIPFAALSIRAALDASAAETVLRFDFSDGPQGWSAGFADYPSGDEAFYELKSEVRSLPAEVDASRNGLFISGNNHSDDLFMFLKRQVAGLEPGAAYRVRIAVEFATNAPSDCAGIGGPPGTGVTMKTGAVTAEPLAVPCTPATDPECPSAGFVLLSIDKGNQVSGGADMAAIGHIGNQKTCPDEAYELKVLRADAAPYRVEADPMGTFWAIIGTDSGFEGTTSLYYSGIEISIEPEAPFPFVRGDANLDGALDLTDAVAVLFHLFTEEIKLPCEPTGDADASGTLDVTDAVALLEHLFRGGPAPAVLTPEEIAACSAKEEFALESAAFAEAEVIPAKHTCDAADSSPPLAWKGVPPGTKSFALACVDRDSVAGTFVHWVAWDIAAASRALGEGEAPPKQGRNGAGRPGYMGPCPTRGTGFHRYFFTLYALDVETLPLAATARLADLESAMVGKILGEASVMGRYRRD